MRVTNLNFSQNINCLVNAGKLTAPEAAQLNGIDRSKLDTLSTLILVDKVKVSFALSCSLTEVELIAKNTAQIVAGQTSVAVILDSVSHSHSHHHHHTLSTVVVSSPTPNIFGNQQVYVHHQGFGFFSHPRAFHHTHPNRNEHRHEHSHEHQNNHGHY